MRNELMFMTDSDSLVLVCPCLLLPLHKNDTDTQKKSILSDTSSKDNSMCKLNPGSHGNISLFSVKNVDYREVDYCDFTVVCMIFKAVTVFPVSGNTTHHHVGKLSNVGLPVSMSGSCDCFLQWGDYSVN